MKRTFGLLQTRNHHLLFCYFLMIPYVLISDLPLFIYPKHESFEQGWIFVLLGWLTILDGNFAWLANPCLFIAFILLSRRPDIALTAVSAALLLGLTIFTYSDMQALDSSKTTSVHLGIIAISLWFIVTTVLMTTIKKINENFKTE